MLMEYEVFLPKQIYQAICKKKKKNYGSRLSFKILKNDA